MKLIQIFPGTYIGPACVGKVVQNTQLEHIDGDRTKRTDTTTIFDQTGQHVLAEHITTISQARYDDIEGERALKRVNHVHREIICAIREERDAIPFRHS